MSAITEMYPQYVIQGKQTPPASLCAYASSAIPTSLQIDCRILKMDLAKTIATSTVSKLHFKMAALQMYNKNDKLLPFLAGVSIPRLGG